MNTKNPYSQHQLYYQPFSKRLCFGTRFQIGSMMFSVMFRNCRNSFFFSFLPQYRYNFIVQLLCVVQLLRRTLHSAVELTTSFVSLVLPCVDDALAQTPGGKTIYWLPLDQFRYLTLYFSPNPQPKNVLVGFHYTVMIVVATSCTAAGFTLKLPGPMVGIHCLEDSQLDDVWWTMIYYKNGVKQAIQLIYIYIIYSCLNICLLSVTSIYASQTPNPTCSKQQTVIM